MYYLYTTEFYLATKKLMELENIILSKTRLRRPKITYSSSYVDYRPEATAEILLDVGHTLRGDCAWENKEREGNLKLDFG
jgi:hypothetical protein